MGKKKGNRPDPEPQQAGSQQPQQQQRPRGRGGNPPNPSQGAGPPSQPPPAANPPAGSQPRAWVDRGSGPPAGQQFQPRSAGRGGPRGPRPPFEPRGPPPQNAPWSQRGPASQDATKAPWAPKPTQEGPREALKTQNPPLPAKEPSRGPPPFKSQPEQKPGKKKGKKGAGGDQPKEESSAPVPTASASPPTSASLSAEGKPSLQSLIIPRRQMGQDIKHHSQFIQKEFILRVNYLPIHFKDMKLKIFHYDVTFKPDGPKSLFRDGLTKVLDKNVKPRRFPAFDGRKNLYAGGSPLKFPTGDTLRDSVKVFDKERLSDKEFDITVKLVSQDLTLSRLAEYMRSGTSLNIPQDVIQSTDIALRHAPISQPRFIQVGRSFFSEPDRDIVDLGGGFDLWHGYYQSAIMAWKPYMNVDVANKAFPRSQPLTQYLQNVQEVRNLNDPLDRATEVRFRRFIKGLKIEYRMPSRDPSGHTKRTYKVDDIGPSPRQSRFKPDKDGSQEVTVEEYFRREKKVSLQFPNLPTLKTSNGNMLPLEFCDVAANQAVMRKLDERQTATMVRNAAKPTDERERRIMSTLRRSNFTEDPCLKEFGISVDMKFEEVNAVVLKPPVLQYQKGSCEVKNGVWRPNDVFIKSPGLNEWIIFNTDRRINPQHTGNLVSQFQKAGRKIGINVSEPRRVLNISAYSEQDFANEFKQYANKGTQLFVVIMTARGVDDIYSKIKRAAELQSGILTQCLKSNTVDLRKMNEMTATNILLKINSKISGVNHTFLTSIKPGILRRPIMVVGADVTHPAPGSEGISIAAVAASHDSYGFQYNMLYRLQPSRREMIDDLEGMITEQLKFFYSKCKVKPERILYYRDGVSEGQFQSVLDIELRAIRAACQKVEDGYKPGITFLVVQKRHHTRFFPGPRDWDGEKNKNVVAGTLVDGKITHPTELDFYLVSHQSIQGTARPTKYHLLWDDNEIGQEELEQLTYYLCHMFARCNRSVSYPAPTYYAHLAAFRARAWWDGQRIDTTRLQAEQQNRGQICTDILQNTPMFFV